ncbi:MAG TPA: hypothetical protein VL284_16080 [Thermoanaerobaculia bacterium]|nr:hypothetical protein [Thermoanaerobaculia bacterium]
MRAFAAVLASLALAAPAVAAGPNIVVISLPQGMVQTIGGGGAADSFTIANVGDAPATVAFQQNGSFFTISASGAVVAPGATQTITIHGLTQNAQAISAGSVTITGSGAPLSGISVPVRLMAGPVPAGTVNMQSSVGGIILTGTASQQHAASVSFHNSGNVQMQGMAVGDAAWLVPQTDFVTVGQNQNGQASFAVDETKRPDAGAPMGGVPGNLSLRFFSGNATAQSVSVSIVDVVRPDIVPAEPAPLAPGELALFIPALSSRSGVTSDFYLAGNHGDTAVRDVKLFFSQAVAGSASLLAAIAQPPSTPALWFPSIVGSVFGSAQQAGSIQLRGSPAPAVSVAAIQVAAPGDGRLFSSPLPLIRSDRSAGPDETLLVTGVEKSSTLSTTLYLQETSGTNTSVQTDFFDASGAAVGTRRVDSVAAFRSIEIPDAVPAGARSVRFTNLGAGRIGAAAVTSDNATLSSWPLVDSARSSPPGTSVWVIPAIAPPGIGAQMEVFVSNGSTSSASFTLDDFQPLPPSSRRHAVHSSALISATTLAPLQTSRSVVTPSNSLLSITAPAQAMTASARMIMTAPGTIGSFGASFPVVPLSKALATSQGMRFTGVDDTQLGARSSLVLAEVGGAATTVRVTLHYIFVAGTAVSAQAISMKDFTLASGQLIVVPNLASAVIGSLRDSLGDLRNMQVDIDVTGGAGKVLPFVESIDNSSGDIMVRAD